MRWDWVLGGVLSVRVRRVQIGQRQSECVPCGRQWKPLLMEEALPDEGVLSGLAPQPSAMGPSPPKPPRYGGERLMLPACTHYARQYDCSESRHSRPSTRAREAGEAARAYLWAASEETATSASCTGSLQTEDTRSICTVSSILIYSPREAAVITRRTGAVDAG